MTEPFDPKIIRKITMSVFDEMSDDMWRRVAQKAWPKRAVKKVDLTNIDAKTHAVIKKLCNRPPRKTTSIEAMAGNSCMQPEIRKSLGIAANDAPSKQKLQRAIVRLINAGKIECLGETRARVYYLTPNS